MSDSAYLDGVLYDAMYADFVADVPLFTGLAAAARGPVLELCCGTGRLFVPAARAGADIDGLDLAPTMLDTLRAKLAAAGLRASVAEGDMRDFALPRRYALIEIGFNSFLHNLTQADQLATLRRCREHLAPGGRLALALFHPSAEKLIQLAAAETQAKEIANPLGPGRMRVIDHCVDDRVEQIRHATRRVEFLDDAGAIVRREHVEFRIRYVFKPEMELLLRVAGFALWRAEPLEAGPDGAWAPASRAMREGDMLLWTAWNEGRA